MAILRQSKPMGIHVWSRATGVWRTATKWPATALRFDGWRMSEKSQTCGLKSLPLHDVSLRQGHSRLTAYAAYINHDPVLARRAWKEFFHGDGRPTEGVFKTRHIVGPDVLRPIDEAPAVSSNGTAQWGLAAIECLAWAGEQLSEK